MIFQHLKPLDSSNLTLIVLKGFTSHLVREFIELLGSQFGKCLSISLIFSSNVSLQMFSSINIKLKTPKGTFGKIALLPYGKTQPRGVRRVRKENRGRWGHEGTVTRAQLRDKRTWGHWPGWAPQGQFADSRSLGLGQQTLTERQMKTGASEWGGFMPPAFISQFS